MSNNSKSNLNLYIQKKRINAPVYHTEKTGSGFSCTVTIEETSFSSLSTHSTKKEAENDAAGVAVEAIIQNQPRARSFEDVLKIFENSKKEKQKKTAVGPEFETIVTSTSSFRLLPSLPLPTTSNAATIHSPIVAPSPGQIYNIHPVSHPMLHSPNSPQFLGQNVQPTPQLMLRSPIMVQPPDQVYNVHHGSQSMPPHSILTQSGGQNLQYPTTPYVDSTFRGGRRDFQPTSHRPPLTIAPTIPMYPNPPALPYRGPLGTNNTPIQLSPKTAVPSEATHHSLQFYSQPPVNNSKIPLSVIGPSIEAHSFSNSKDKPCNAIPSKSLSSIRSSTTPAQTHSTPLEVEHQSLPSSRLLATIPSVNVAIGVRDLEDYCRALSLPEPWFNIVEDKPGIFVGKVIVGNKEFVKGWKYNSFNDAKDSAAIVAIAALAMMQLRDSLLAGNIEALKLSGSPKPIPQYSSQSPGQYSIINPGQVPILQQTQQFFPKSKSAPSSTSPIVTGLQTPSFFQQPLSAKGGGDALSYLNPSQQPQGSNGSVVSNTQYPSQKSSSIPIMSVNLKSQLNEYCQRKRILPPVYDCSYPDNEVGYIVSVKINGTMYKSASHKTKRAAEEDVAQIIMEVLPINLKESREPLGPRKQATSETVSLNTPAVSISYKNLLQEKAQKEKVSKPRYVTEKIENEEVLGFVSTVTVYLPSGQSLQKSSSSRHTGKKTAEQEAAKLACAELNLL